jgi:hypothetical protein
MARPRTALGTSGKTTSVGQVQVEGRWITAPEGSRPTRWRARAKFRDRDGMLRDVERYETTRAKAEAQLKNALRDRTTPRTGDHLRKCRSRMLARCGYRPSGDPKRSSLCAP